MREAINLAHDATRSHEVPIGAVLVADEKVIGRGYNSVISLNDPTAHAECMALRDAGEELQNYRLLETTLYVTLEPCLMCVGALVHARVRRVIFGATEPKTGAVVSNLRGFELPHHNHKVEFYGGVLDSDCRKLIQQFFLDRRSPGNE